GFDHHALDVAGTAHAEGIPRRSLLPVGDDRLSEEILLRHLPVGERIPDLFGSAVDQDLVPLRVAHPALPSRFEIRWCGERLAYHGWKAAVWSWSHCSRVLAGRPVFGPPVSVPMDAWPCGA